ncbi:nudix hydrolase 17, mitochondrial-like isoform X2 [Olea europaea var. sylvestris]|uniref:nudix hydrolase 17, mitochondrial-like isoform X2 n=1 Tax=Olea europaea var. sylvestris TaxID=158386 RepID=UPI000C1CF443|nr:nudix hydrolase 17, mitochondrial-like isoform X2 [Olea europaea var. sylvestris]
MLIKKLVSLPSRSGRHLQRYNDGCRLVVGCIPYRFRETKTSPPIHGTVIEELEVLLITSQKSPRMMFPKDKLGEWIFKSRSRETFHEGYMFPMLVTEEFDVWPEKNVRQRTWMTVNEAREVCAHSWMKEALDAFCSSIHASSNKEKEFLL